MFGTINVGENAGGNVLQRKVILIHDTHKSPNCMLEYAPNSL